MKTAESVAPGHPDKICDQISDAILDDILRQDPMARVAIETMGGHGIVTITGELTTEAYCDMSSIAKRVYRGLGYTSDIGVQVNVVRQSPEISQGVDTGGAGDQGIMVGFACQANAALMPLEVMISRKLLQDALAAFPYLGPDGKCQITIDGMHECVHTVVLSVQTPKNDSHHRRLLEFIKSHVALSSLDMRKARILINPTGAFTVGGFDADTGLTGRKLAIDNYGPQIPIGGGAFSGKDPSKVDRSAAYMARKIARDYVKRGAEEALVKIAYSIGVADPVMATVTIGGLTTAIPKGEYDLRPLAIIEQLGLRAPIYEQTARWGHFGIQGPSWEA